MKPLVTDGLWAVVAPLLPRRRAQPKGGRPWMDDRATLNGVLYVLRTGIAWRHLPTELGWGSGVTCWRRLRERPRHRPRKLHADKGYDYRRCRDECAARGVQHRIAR